MTAQHVAETKEASQFPEMNAVKARMRKTWESGNWDYFSRFMESSSAEFLERVNPDAGSKLLDVACGSGGLCLMAARKGLEVTGIDLAASNVEAARGRALSEGLTIHFDEGDAESLPYADASFDLVTSIFGAMFAPQPELVANELLRVCRQGGRVAMGNWTPGGFIGKMFKLVSEAVPPTGTPSPVLWGSPNIVEERFGNRVADLKTTPVLYRFDYPFGPEEVTEFFRENFGPLNRAHASLSASGAWEDLRARFTDLWRHANRAPESGRTVVDAEYLFVTARRA